MTRTIERYRINGMSYRLQTMLRSSNSVTVDVREFDNFKEKN